MTDTSRLPADDTRTVTAFFDTRDHAEKAKADLVARGIPDAAITMVVSQNEAFDVAEGHKQGFWEALTNFFMPDDDRRVYEEGLRRGGVALSVQTGEALYDQTIDVLDRDGAVDLDERALRWESEGWTRTPAGGIDTEDVAYNPADASTAGFGASHSGEDVVAPVDEATNPDFRERIGAGTASQTAPAAQGGPHTYTHPASPASDAAADAAEGRSDGAAAGQRDRSHGRSRVWSYIMGDDIIGRDPDR